MKPPVWISAIPAHEARPGPLAGLRFAIKDNIDYAGVPTTAGCPEFAYTPLRSAEAVERLEAAGALAVGKTNLDQFATGLVGVRSPYGACSSVYGAAYISGGSSSGSAVAVASGQVDFALGTDTAGSGRIPAAFNNLTGLKPSRGAISTAGVVPACASLDCVSLFTRDALTAKRVFECLAPRRPLPPWASGPFRFGVPEELEFFGDNASEVLFAEAVRRMERLGGTRVPFDYSPFRAAASLLYSGPWVAERYAAVGDFLEAHPGKAHPVVEKIIRGGKSISAVEAFRGAYRLGELVEAAQTVWDQTDVLLLPTAPTIYTIAEVENDPVRLNTNLGYYTNFVNLMDLAALAIPAGFREDGLPFGVSLIGPRHSDWALLELASRAEEIRLTVVGAHLLGQPLNRQLTDRGARLLKACRTAKDYRLFALANTSPPKPGLVREPGFDGPGIEVEVWAMPAQNLGGFLALIPPPLGLGTLTLDDGTASAGFICEPAAVTQAAEITSYGGWKNYLLNR